MRLLILTLFLSLTACGSGGGDSAAPSKDLFSVWTADSNGFVLDMSAGSFGIAQAFTFVTGGGEVCDCQFSVLGTQGAGNWTMAACTYRAATGGGVDPGCASLNGNGNYTNASAALSVCDSGGCDGYH